MKKSVLALTIASVAGVGVTAVLAAKSATKYERIIHVRDISATEAVKIYAPTIVSGIATSVAICSSTYISNRYSEALMKIIAIQAMALKRTHEESERDRSEQFVKEATDKYKRYGGAPIYPQTFYSEYYDKLFERTWVDIMDAEYQLNRYFAINGAVSVKEFFNLLGLDTDDKLEALGWAQDDYPDRLGYFWIDFDHDISKLDDGMEVHEIKFRHKPYDYLPF